MATWARDHLDHIDRGDCVPARLESAALISTDRSILACRLLPASGREATRRRRRGRPLHEVKAMPVTIVVQLLVLHLILTVPHELGHFIAARLVGVSVLEFGIGLPPKVIEVTWRGTRWSFNLLPLGAFVGYDAEQASPLARRSAIAVAGPLANFLV